jgi:diguanylate cyclase (GGDEF)-like protein
VESAAKPDVARPIEAALIEAAARHAARSAGTGAGDPAGAIDAAIDAFVQAVAGVLPSVFVVEHGRLWLVAQRGYAVAPDGITVERGIIGRACRLGRAQLARDVHLDRDYVPALPGIVSELAIPLRSGRELVGVLNAESERPLPHDAVQAVRPLARALAPLAAELRERGTLDLAALARLFVHLGSLREPEEIAELAAASLARVLPVHASQVVVWDELASPRQLAAWRSNDDLARQLTLTEIEAARASVDSTAVCEVLDVPSRSGVTRDQAVVWLPLRASASELGALLAVSRGGARQVDPRLLDTAAVLAAHVGVSLDAALALGRERRSAVSDPLTGILNRRGLEERLELELATSQEQRVPLSLLVIDCDDFKDVNDRAGHEFGDTILREIADVLSRSLPDGAVAARIGGDEFVVMLPSSGAEAAETLGGEIRVLLANGLTEAGFPVRVSAGISTYPYDGAAPSALLRAADQALYVAKSGGKDRVASFREVASRAVGSQPRRGEPADARRGGRSDGPGSMLADAISAVRAIEAEEGAEGVCRRLCKALVFVVGATGCVVSRIVGDLLVEVEGHALREVQLSDEVAYRIADFPATAEVLRRGRPHATSFVDQHVDPAEAFILRDLGMNALLMLPIVVGGQAWGLVELYEMRLRSFDGDEIAVAEFLVHQVERRLEVVGDIAEPMRGRRRVYELPPDGPRTPRTR